MAEKDLSAVAERIYLSENSMLCYGPLVSEFGGGAQCMVPPNPVIGGGCVPPGSAAYDNKYTNTQTEAPTHTPTTSYVVVRKIEKVVVVSGSRWLQ